MKELGVGLLGFGIVGAGVADTLVRNAGLLSARSGARLSLRWIADLDIERDRGVAVEPALLTRDAAAVVDDPRVDIVVELIGGTRVARELVTRALRLGKPVVTANKALLADHGAELFRIAREHNAEIFFEASVAGGVPIIRALREGLVANRIQSVHGILNGTCNYILTRMEAERRPFAEVLTDAQAAGYAEADPSLDVDGIDTAHKAVILAALAHGRVTPLDAVRIDGIRTVSLDDITYAGELGYRIKLLAIIRERPEGIEIGVEPTLIPAGHLLAQVDGVFNAILVSGDIVGDTLYYGRGAGRYPTASAVVSDLAEVARRLDSGESWGHASFQERTDAPPLCPREAISARHYLRLGLRDQPDVLARVAHVLGRHGISIASVVQKERCDGAFVPCVILTHRAGVLPVEAAGEEISGMDCVEGPPVSLRVEDFA